MLFRTILFVSLPLTSMGILYSLNVRNFWTYFFTSCFTVGLQYAIDFAFHKFAIVRYGLRIKETNLQIEKEYNKRGVELTCPCAEKSKCFVPIDLNQGTSYKCLQCDKQISVYVKLGTALETEPVVVQSLEALPLNLNE